MQNERLRGELSRRAFWVAACATGAALAVGAGCGGAATPRAHSGAGGNGVKRDPNKLGVALLGLGNYSETQLAPALRKTQHIELRGLVTGSPHKIRPWQEQYGVADRNVYDYASLARIADNPDIDVVYVVVPTALHAKYAIMAAQAGKHVFLEKPMAMTVQECQAVIDACRKNGVFLSIGYRMQHEPNTQTVASWARSKPYGAIKKMRAVAGDKNAGEPSWRMQRAMGGGALYDMGVYSINALRHASGEEPLRVLRARQWAERPELFTEVDENTELELEFPSGVIGYGLASRSHSQNILQIEAERGSYKLEPMQKYTGVQGETSDGKKLDLPIDNQQAKQMDDDALAIRERRAPLVPGEEGMRDIRIVQAVIESAQTGRAVELR